MGAILKIKIPFFRRKTAGTGDGFATFYLGTEPTYLPTLNQTVLITHTNVPINSGLLNKLTNVSSNTIPALFQSFQQNVDPVAMSQTDGYANFFVLKYLDNSFSTSQFAGDCTGYIEYDVNPTTYSVLKPIETAVIVNDVVPFDLSQGYNGLYGSRAGLTGSTQQILPILCVDKRSTSSIFANALKSLNIPISDDETLKYSRTALGYYTTPTGTQVATVKVDGIPYYWNPVVTPTLPGSVRPLTHPITGVTGEYYDTVLQTIGSTQFVADLDKLPVPNNMFLIFEIPSKTYGEIIDGKSVKLTMPWWSGQTHTSPINKYLGIPHHYKASPPTTVEIYGTYNKSGLNVYNLDNTLSEKDMSMQDLGSRPDLSLPISNYESNVVLLFSDTIQQPFEAPTGSWSSGHNNVINGVSVFNPNAREKNLYDYLNDTCVGVAFLDKGFVVITHPTFVDSFFVNALGGKLGTGGTLSNPVKTYDYYGNIAKSTAINRKFSSTNGGVKIYTGTTTPLILTRDSTNKVEWENSQYLYTGATAGQTPIPTTPFIEYLSYNTEKSLNIVCLASSDEFFKSTNDTAKQLLNVDDAVDYASFKSSSENLYPLQITQLGIHDADGNLLAVCKPNQPIPKYWYDVVSFNVKIRL